MSNLGSQIIYKQLLARHGRVRIPIIQRDYAQGRPGQKEVREEFLSALEEALKKTPCDSTLPLNLDFIYGSVEGKDETHFLPLDGQQRLTTLFLLHWYLAWNDRQWNDFRALFRANGHARFSYSVRPSSNDFFDALVAYEPACPQQDVERLSVLIADQPWYFRSWRLDPTVQSALVMLDAIHARFSSSKGLYARLLNESQPAITFQLLDLDNFGLSDDLYIKMNARGKPLTSFETFKARYEHELERQFPGEFMTIGSGNVTVAGFVSRRMDTLWADLFWVHRDKSSNLYDDAVMNLFRAVAFATRNPESPEYLTDVEMLREEFSPPSYGDFYSRGWLDRNFTITLIRLLEAWSSGSGTLRALLPSPQYFNEKAVFQEIIADGANLSYSGAVQFVAYTTFVCENHAGFDTPAFQEWMRVIRNLSVNTSYDRLPDMQRSVAGVLKLSPRSTDILKHFATAEKPAAGFSEQQIAEERLKAELILSDSGWRPLIDRAEGHGYFSGQIGFLFDFCGATKKWNRMGGVICDNDEHLSLQERFESYLKKAEAMFSARGLASLEEYRWERALLCIGDYTLPSGGRNRSFLVNSSGHPASWKRLLRGTGTTVSTARETLHQLLDRLSDDVSLEKQLDQIIAGAAGLEPWLRAFVETPEALKYCGERVIRWTAEEEIYLLKKSQMNGAHAELFTFCFFHNSLKRLSSEGRITPLELSDYQSVSGTDDEPHALLVFEHGEYYLTFAIKWLGCFHMSTSLSALANIPQIQTLLTDRAGFRELPGGFLRITSSTDMENALLELAQALASITSNDAIHA